MTKDAHMIAKKTRPFSVGAKAMKFFAGAILFGLLGLSIAPVAQAATSSSSSTSTVGTTCADAALAESLYKANEASYNNDLAQRIGAGTEAQRAAKKYPQKNAFGDVEKYYCIGKIHDFLDSLRGLLDGDLIGLIIGFILGLLEDLLNAACQLVVDAINAVLEMICLPLPKMGLPNFQVPGLDGVSCDGISLADYIRVDYGDNFDFDGSEKMPSDLMSVPLSAVRPRGERERTYNLYNR